jgi:Spy/CpxP family protein refolding chaperone
MLRKARFALVLVVVALALGATAGTAAAGKSPHAPGLGFSDGH